MHISEKLLEARKAGRPTFAFEFFPPKTAQVCHPRPAFRPNSRQLISRASRVFKISMTVGDLSLSLSSPFPFRWKLATITMTRLIMM